MDNEAHTSRILNLPVIGSIATMPSRSSSFSKMLHGILPQVDRLFIYLDGFEKMPAELQEMPKCQVTILPVEKNLHASSRFLAPHMFDSEAIVVLFDDDILYPPDYVSSVKHALSRYGENCVVGFHGVIFMPPHHSYVSNRHTFHFSSRLDNDVPVHELGCGTAAFISSLLHFHPSTWRNHKMDDLYLAAEAVKANVKLVALKRNANWITALAENQDDSLWRSTLQDDLTQSNFMRDILTQYMQMRWHHWWQKSS